MSKKIYSLPAIAIIITIVFLIGAIVILATNLQKKGEPVSFYKFEEPKAKDETAGWQIYKSEYYGIDIKYPKQWAVIEPEVYDDYIVLMNNDDSFQQIMILKSSGPPPETMDMEILEIEDIVVDGIATKRELFRGRFENNKDKYYLRVFISEKSLFYHADFDESILEEFSSTYDKILSTFRFID